MVQEDKKPYEKPRLTEYGSVSDLTLIKGKTFLTDVEMTGSGTPPGLT